jgi:3',5'-cyclic AMP phosphodiesterase CpdA
MTVVLHCSDLHFGRTLPHLVERFKSAVHALMPDVLVVSGDLTTLGTRSEFEQAKAFLQAIEAPVLAVPGNHDVPAKNMFVRFLMPMSRFESAIGPANPSWTGDDLEIIGLNSARPWGYSLNWAHGRLSHRQIASAEQQLKRSMAAHKLIVVHHPLVVPEDLAGFRTLGRMNGLRAIIARHRVDAVLTGHLHRADSFSVGLPDQHDGMLRVISAGTPFSPRLRNQVNSFNLLRFNRGQLSLTCYVHNENTRTFEPSGASEANHSTPGSGVQPVHS